MATREIELPTVLYHDDSQRTLSTHKNTLATNYGTASINIGDAAKGFNESHKYDRHEVAIPKGSEILRAQVRNQVNVPTDPWKALASEFPLVKLGILAPDGWWNSHALQQGYQDEVHWISQVLDTGDVEIFKSSLPAHGPDQILRGTEVDPHYSYGMKFDATADQTLGSVLLRMKRDEGSHPGVTFRVLVYSVTAVGYPPPYGSGDPRPGTLLATSDPVDFDSLPTTYGSANPPTGWVQFFFTGGDQYGISDGEGIVFMLVPSAPITSTPFASWCYDDDRREDGAPPIGDQGNLPWPDPEDPSVTTVFGIMGGLAESWEFNFYATNDKYPTALFPGTTWTDDFYPDDEDLLDEYWNTWGDAGYGCDATIGLAELIQAFIDHASYDESGMYLATYVLPAEDPPLGFVVPYRSHHWTSGYLGQFLKINYTEPVPGKATNPSPADMASGVAKDVTLSWTAGSYAGTGAVTHDVYFGLGPTLEAAEFKGNQPGTTWDPPGDLQPGWWYYWRIDEVGEFETTIGDVWAFRVALPLFPGKVRATPALLPRIQASPEILQKVSGSGELVIPVITSEEGKPRVSGSPELAGNVSAEVVFLPAVNGAAELVIPVLVSGGEEARVLGEGELFSRVSASVDLASRIDGEASLDLKVDAAAELVDEVE